MSSLVVLAQFIANHPLTRDRKLHACGRFVRWQIESRFRDEVVVPWIEGTKLAVRRGMAGATGNIYCGLHEFQDMAFTLHFLRSDDLFVDIGANIGSYTILASGVCRAQTVAFEPDPGAFSTLCRNVALNRLNSLVTGHECAVGGNSGFAQFTVGLDTMNRVSNGAATRTRTVAMDTLDNALVGKNPSMLKLDVEGFESEVIKGAQSILDNPNLRAIITEDHSPLLAAALHKFGFTVFHYDAMTRSLSLKQHKYKSQNTLFLRGHEFVQERLLQAESVRIFDQFI